MTVLRKLNPEAESTNLFQLTDANSGCCPPPGAVCRYRIVFAGGTISAGSMVVLDKDGNEATLTFSGTMSTAETLLAAIKAALSAAPSAGGAGALVDGGITITTYDGDAVLLIDSDVPIVSVGAVTAEKGCTGIAICQYRFFVDVDAVNPVLTEDGDDSTITHTFATGSAAAAETAFNAAITGGNINYVLGDDYLGVIVTENVDDGVFQIDVQVNNHPVMKINGTEATLVGCRESFEEDGANTILDVWAGADTAAV